MTTIEQIKSIRSHLRAIIPQMKDPKHGMAVMGHLLKLENKESGQHVKLTHYDEAARWVASVVETDHDEALEYGAARCRMRNFGFHLKRGRPRLDGSHLGYDLSKSDSEIAKERGVTRQCISLQRARFFPETCHKKVYQKLIKSIDWSLDDETLSEKHGIKLPYLRFLRKNHAPDTWTRKTKKRKYDWANVDYSKGTSVIARELGVMPQYVVKWRKKYAPETVRVKKMH
jgi:hypothetical protein